MNGLVQIELVLGAIQPCRELAQPAERHLELPGIEHIVLTEIPKVSLSRHLQRGTALPCAAHTDALRRIAGVAKRRGASSADPVLSTVVTLGLLLEPLFQHLANLFRRQAADAAVHFLFVIGRLLFGIG